MSKSTSTAARRRFFREHLPWALAGLALAVLASRSELARRSAEVVPEGPIPHVYVQSKVGSETKCLVTDRAGATVRRSEPDLGKTRWKCRWLDGPDGPVLSALTGKEPSYLFVPEGAVLDPALPFLYEQIRKVEELPLPRVRWAHLFFDRTYRGLYLQIRLPDKRLLTREELGRGEILEAEGASAACWNRKLEGACLLWKSAFIAEAIFPDPAWTPGTALLHELLTEAGLESRAFVLTELGREGRHLWPWPLPMKLSRQLEPERFGDDRYRSWQGSPETPSFGPGLPEHAALDLPTAEDLRRTLTEAGEASPRREGTGASMEERLQKSPTLRRLAAWEGR